jgi:hypothetical protein
MEVITLGNPFLEDYGTLTPIVVPSYEAEEAVIELTTGYNPYIINGSGGDSYWTKSTVTTLNPILTTDKVVIGGVSFLGTEVFRVVGGANITRLTFGSESTYITSVKDEDTLVSNDAHAIPTQQSVKAYVDNAITTGLQPGDNISLLTNDVPYLITETDPIFVASPVYTVTSTQITHWDTAYGWGNHASAGYLSIENDPIFTASEAYLITTTDTTNWDTAYTNNHTHTNKTLLDSLISSGAGTSALMNDGTYKSIAIIAGSDTYVQFNDGGIFGGDSTFTFNKTTNRLSVENITVTTNLDFNVTPSTTYIYEDGSSNLTFVDSVSGSATLADLLGAGTSFTFTSPTGWIETSSTVGGIPAGTPVASLNGQTLVAILRMMLFSTPSNPIFVIPTETIVLTEGTPVNFNGLYVERGSTSIMTIVGTFVSTNGPGGKAYALFDGAATYELNDTAFTNPSSVTFTSGTYKFEVNQVFKSNGLGEADPEFVVLSNGATVYANDYTGYAPGTATNTKTYTAVDPIYYGAFTAGTSDYNTVPTWVEITTGCTKLISVEPTTLTVNITTYSGTVNTHEYICVAYPDSYGLLSHIYYVEGGNNDVISSFLNTTETYTRTDSTTVTYRVYYALNSYSGETTPRTLHYTITF